MIAERFLTMVETAPPVVRARATELLARAYLGSPLTDAAREACASALTLMLDDPSPEVREAMAEVLADSAAAPRAVIVGLAGDLPAIACPVVERSPLLTVGELVEAAGSGPEAVRIAVARRSELPMPAAAAVAAVGGFAAALALVENAGADIPAFSLEALLERHGGSAAFREAFLARSDLPSILKVRAELRMETDPRNVSEAARESLILSHAVTCEGDALDEFAADLRSSGLLSSGLVLRALLEDRTAFVAAALGVLAGVPTGKAELLLAGSGFWPLYGAAGLPEGLRPVFAAALSVARPLDEAGAGSVLRACAEAGIPDGHPVFHMLARIHADLAREAARERRRRELEGPATDETAFDLPEAANESVPEQAVERSEKAA